MSTTETSNGTGTQVPETRRTDMKLEVVILPVSDASRAKQFYASLDVATLAELLLETAMAHDRFEKAAPAHDWWDWYAPYLDARQHGSTSEQATAAADRYMAEAHGVVVSG